MIVLGTPPGKRERAGANLNIGYLSRKLTTYGQNAAPVGIRRKI
jgi:hypothetical protein